MAADINSRRERFVRRRRLRSRIQRAYRMDLPREIKIEVTACCNLDCAFCYNRNSFARGGRPDVHFPIDLLCRVIDDVAKSGIPVIRFSGGEPLLYPYISHAVTHAYAKGLYVKMNTNAVLAADMAEERFDAIFSCVDEAVISYHDYYPGSPSNMIRKKEEGIIRIRKCGVFLVSNTVLTTGNISHIPWFVQKGGALSDFHFFAFPVPSDQAPGPDRNQIGAAVRSLWNLRQQGHEVHLAQAIPFCSAEPEKFAELHEGIQCGMHDNLVIDPEGHIKLCYSFPDAIGEVGKDNLLLLWNSPEIKNIRTLSELPDACKDCVYADRCKGGCRFASFWAEGDMLALDPRAHPQEYSDILFSTGSSQDD